MLFSQSEKYIADAVNKFSDMVFRIAFQYTKDRYDAEDIMQEVFLQLYKTPLSLPVDERLKARTICAPINGGMLQDAILYLSFSRIITRICLKRLTVCLNVTAMLFIYITTKVIRRVRLHG